MLQGTYWKLITVADVCQFERRHNAYTSLLVVYMLEAIDSGDIHLIGTRPANYTDTEYRVATTDIHFTITQKVEV